MTAGRRALVVEDEAVIAMELEALLSDMGLEVVGIAADAARALELARKWAPDVIVLDVRLARRGDGVAVAHDLRAFCSAPIVFATAHPDEATLEWAMSVGRASFVTKPFDARTISEAVTAALREPDAG